MVHVAPISPIDKFKTAMLKSSLCNYSDWHLLAKETITVENNAALK